MFFEQGGSLPVGSDESNLQLAEASNHTHPDLLNHQALVPQLLLKACLTCPGTVEPGNTKHLSAFNIILKILSSHISNHMHGFDIGKKCWCLVLPSMQLTPNISKSFSICLELTH
jgi:hypothetical protein